MTPEIFTSHTGAREPLNADHVEHWSIEGGHVYLVCDGINHIDQTASIVRKFCSTLKDAIWNHPQASLEEILSCNILKVMDSLSQEDQGTSLCLSVAILTHDQMIIGHCGDCRVGHLTDNGVEWLSTDDVPFLLMYREGLLTEEEYNQSRHLLSCKLKTGHHNQGQLKTATLSKPESRKLLLCSDGFWAECEHLIAKGDSENCLQVIKEQIPILTSTAQDNFSVIVV